MKTQLMIALLLAAGTTMARNRSQGRQQPPSAQDMISRLDTDNDGKISQSEFDGPSEHFTQFDADGDGYLSESELPPGPPRRQDQESQGGQQGQCPERGGQGQGGFVSRLDQDGDGKVSQSEFDGPDSVFSELDKDNDGYLTESEAPSGPPPQGGGRRR